MISLVTKSQEVKSVSKINVFSKFGRPFLRASTFSFKIKLLPLYEYSLVANNILGLSCLKRFNTLSTPKSGEQQLQIAPIELTAKKAAMAIG